MTISRFHVAAMDCTAEEQLVRMHLQDLAGVERIAVDLTQREVTIQHHTEFAALDAAMASLDLGSTHLGDGGELGDTDDARPERRALTLALIINAAFFVGELTVGLISRSMGLIADALDMGADASVYALSLAAVGSSVARKHALARTSGLLQLALAAIGLVEVFRRFLTTTAPPDTTSMIVVSTLALAGNIATLMILRGVRSGEVHFQASWIFTANDIKVNALVIVAAIAVSLTNNATPDLIAGTIIFVIVANGARRILRLTNAPPTAAAQ